MMNTPSHPFYRHRTPRATPIVPALALLLLVVAAPVSRGVEARIKDIARIDGLTGVSLVGYGIIVGLSGTGDKDLMITKQTMANLFQQFQIKLPTSDIKSKNVAAVMVTAYAPPFHRSGDHIDVEASSIGDAVSLEGGILLMTPLLDPEGKLYALAQGGLTIGGYSAGAAGPGGQTETKNYTTVGMVPGGAILRETQPDTFIQNGSFRLVLLHADFTTATRMASAINATNEGSATARDAGSVLVRVPPDILDVGQVATFVAGIETLTVSPDSQSRIIVNERTGTLVMGGEVHIGEAIVAHGNLTVSVGSTLSAYMPNSLTDAKPVVTEKIAAETKEDKAKDHSPSRHGHGPRTGRCAESDGFDATRFDFHPRSPPSSGRDSNGDDHPVSKEPTMNPIANVPTNRAVAPMTRLENAEQEDVLRQASRGVEGMFIGILLKQGLHSTEEEAGFQEPLQEFAIEQTAAEIGQGEGCGIADMIYDQLRDGVQTPVSTPGTTSTRKGLLDHVE